MDSLESANFLIASLSSSIWLRFIPLRVEDFLISHVYSLASATIVFCFSLSWLPRRASPCVAVALRNPSFSLSFERQDLMCGTTSSRTASMAWFVCERTRIGPHAIRPSAIFSSRIWINLAPMNVLPVPGVPCTMETRWLSICWRAEAWVASRTCVCLPFPSAFDFAISSSRALLHGSTNSLMFFESTLYSPLALSATTAAATALD